MTLNLRIFATIFSIAALVAFRFGHNNTSLLLLLIAVLFLIGAIITNKGESETDRHEKEQRKLFMASLEVIKQRVGIKLDQIGRFKELFEQNKYFLNPKEEQTISNLISDLGDVRILDEETRPYSAITKEQREEYIRERRIILDRIENIEVTIEKYLRNLL